MKTKRGPEERYRVLRCVSAQSVGAKLGVSTSTIYGWEKKRRGRKKDWAEKHRQAVDELVAQRKLMA